MTFARTKIQLPQFRVDLIERPGLETGLGAALLGRRLVLLAAAAGYGKTAALARQCALLPADCAVAWIKADEEDDLARLLLCMVRALEAFDPPWRMAPEALAAQATLEGGLRTAAAEFTNTLRAISVAHGVIAIDDVHLLADPEAFRFLGVVLEMLPETWTLALATRDEPPLALARWRVRGELAEFGQAEIAFTREEIQQLCDLRREKDDGTLARALFERTQGWTAGVSLSLQELGAGRLHHSIGGHRGQRHLYAYLAAEVFDRMPEELREFLLRCSVLPELTEDRCATVAGSDRAGVLLEEIDRRGLFVSGLDGETLTLRLHDLFRDFLEEQLRRAHPEELPLLLRRAAAGETDHLRKINLLLRAGARCEAEQVLAAAAPALLTTNDGAQVQRLIKLFPGERSDASPWLAYVSGLWSWYQFEDRALCASMRDAATGFERLGERAAAQDARSFEAISRFMIGESDIAHELMSEVRQGPLTLEVRVMIELFGYLSEGYGGSPQLSARHLGNVLDLLEGGAGAVVWNRCIPRTFMLLGRRDINLLLRRFARGAIAAAGEHDEALFIAAKQMQAWLELWRADLSLASAAIESLRTDFRWQGHTRALRLSLIRLTVTFHHLRGDRARMRAALKGILSDGFDAASMHPDFRMDMLTQICRYHAALGDWPTVTRMMRRIDSPRRKPRFAAVSASADCCKARFALHERRNDDALRCLRELVRVSMRHDRMGLDASVRIFLAVAELRADRPHPAWLALAPLVEEVRDSGDVAPVLLAGEALIDELARAPWDDAAPPEGLAALRAWRDLARRWHDQPNNEATVVDSARLSARELEVVAAIAQGQSNKLIARALGLSPHTVKRHVARALERLDVRGRGEAAAWYHGYVTPDPSAQAAGRTAAASGSMDTPQDSASAVQAQPKPHSHHP